MCRKFILPALGAGLFVVGAAQAGVDEWTDLGLPAGASATAVATDPVDDAAVYVATAGGVVYKSTDAGANWTATDLHQFEDPGDQPPVLSALAIDADNPDIVVAGADYGRIFRSDDGGVTWKRDRVGQGNQTIHGLELDLGPFGGAIAAASNGIWFTTALTSGAWDVDLSWTVGGSVPSGCRHVHALAVVRTSPDAMYAGTDCGLFKSTVSSDVGDPLAWQQVPTVPNAPVRAIVLDPFEADTLYVSGDQGIRKLTSGGGSASLISSGLPQQSAYALAIDPLTDNVLYAGLVTQGMYKGNPAGGGAWLSFNSGLGPQGILALAVSWPDPQRLYAIAAGGDAYGIRQSQSPAKAIDLVAGYAQLPPASYSLKTTGGAFQAAVTLRNLGPATAKNVKFVLSFVKLGALLQLVSANADVTVTALQSNRGSCSIATLSCAIDTLGVQGSATVTFRVQPKSTLGGTRLTTVATVGGVDVIWSAGDLKPADNQAKASTSITK